LRIISGSAKGRKLFSPGGGRIRPTSDRVKEALFSIISGLLESFSGCSVLDIFAGTGNLGIEALSRGASRAVFIDSHRDSAALVRKNLELTGFLDRSRVICRDALAALKALEDSGESFRLVFIDPPYYGGLLEKVLEFLSASRLLEDGSLVIAEHSARETIREEFGPLREFDRRTYGDTVLAFYTMQWRGKPWTRR
jgi:16S rRNA (guanine(966)-N(2))-methyltransferase RsmD